MFILLIHINQRGSFLSQKKDSCSTLIGFSTTCIGFSKFSVVIFHPKFSTFFNDMPVKRENGVERIEYKEIVGATLPPVSRFKKPTPVSPLSPVSVIAVVILVIPAISTLFPSPLNSLQVVLAFLAYLSPPFRYKYLCAGHQHRQYAAAIFGTSTIDFNQQIIHGSLCTSSAKPAPPFHEPGWPMFFLAAGFTGGLFANLGCCSRSAVIILIIYIF